MDVSTIIDAFGGNTVLAKAIGVLPNTVSMWRTSGIPAARCLGIARLAQRMNVPGVTLESLLTARPQKELVDGPRPRR